MKKLQGIYEEYKCLNDEIAFHRENAVKNRNHCVILFTVLAGCAIKYNEIAPYLFIIAWLIILYYWRNYNVSCQHEVKISRYISKYLEGNKTELHWQTRVQRDELQNVSRLRVVWTMRTSPHAVMSLACLFGFTFYLIPWHQGNWWIAIGIVGIAILTGFNFWLTSRISNEPWYNMRKKWRDFWDEPPAKKIVARLKSKDTQQNTLSDG